MPMEVGRSGFPSQKNLFFEIDTNSTWLHRKNQCRQSLSKERNLRGRNPPNIFFLQQMRKCSLSSSLSLTVVRHCSSDAQHPQQKLRGVAELIVEAEPSIAMSPTPPKRGRYTPRRVSGIQLEVLQLYRNLLKESRKFEDPASRDCLSREIAKQFRVSKEIPRKMVSKIEWQMHYGQNKLEELKNMKTNSKFRIV